MADPIYQPGDRIRAAHDIRMLDIDDRWVVMCNRLAYADGEYDTELGKVIVYSTIFHMPINDLTVTTLEEWESF